MTLNFDLSEEHELVRRTVREFAEERVAPVAEELDREHRFPYELVAELAELGLMGMPIPEEYGGAGADTLSYAIAIEELTRIDSSVAITVAAHTSLGTMPIFLFGTEEQKREWLPRARLGRAARGVRADRAGRRLGRRRDAHARRAARRRVGRQRLEDLHHERRHRHHRLRDDHRAHRRGRDLEPHRPERHARLRDLAADAEARLARLRHARALVRGLRACPRGTCSARAAQGFRQFLEILDGGRISVAAMGVGLAQGAYDLAVAYAKEREQFGQPIAQFQAVQFQLADMATEIEAGRALVYKAAWLKDQGRPFAQGGGDGEALHRRALATAPSNAALQIHGGYGFMDEFADLAVLPRPEDPRDRRGHERGPAHGRSPSTSASRSRARLSALAVRATVRTRGRNSTTGESRSAVVQPPTV